MSNGLQLYDLAETIKWLRLQRLDLKRELRRLRLNSPGVFGTAFSQSIRRERFLKRAIRTATFKLDILRGKKKA